MISSSRPQLFPSDSKVSFKTKLRQFRRRKRDPIAALLILGPLVLWWFVIGGVPTLFGFLLGFFDWVGLTAKPEFIGLGNYVQFFTDPIYYESLFRAVWMGMLGTGLTILFGFGAALLMNLPLRGRGIYRTIWYVPVVTSTVATTQVFNIFLDPSNGVINNVLVSMGLQPILWGYSTFWGVFWIIVYTVWKGIGGTALLWLAGLQSIDRQLYEAAQMDGANAWKRFLHVTMPGLKPITTYVMITGFIGAVQIYEQVMFITGGGPYGTTEVLVFRILRDAFWDFNLGMAGASSVILAGVVFLFTVIYFRMMTENERTSRKRRERG
ncbi:carbohydrate ABC transporter permease [Paenibacillus sp. FJAT-27812]|uniref:carbohydrate ABC transporter permease n=1 Tax=Paenibacillus sp. FJAT-27812 TaxID=1684143 RepID=UPI0006A7C6C9|nr:sugar ABC transporter permease [Paenibacillus sp. FJAT-27812]